MKRVVATLVAVLSPCIAAGQETSHHAKPQPAAAPPAAGPDRPLASAASVKSAYDSPFDGYRPFSEPLAPKDWRKANDEVREAGGHIGLMKGEPAQLTGHGAHGAKQPVPPASPERK
jgi:hypothetical protein